MFSNPHTFSIFFCIFDILFIRIHLIDSGSSHSKNSTILSPANSDFQTPNNTKNFRTFSSPNLSETDSLISINLSNSKLSNKNNLSQCENNEIIDSDITSNQKNNNMDENKNENKDENKNENKDENKDENKNENKNDNKSQLFISFSPTNYSSESPSNSVIFQDCIKDCLGLRSEEKNSTVHTFLKLLKTYENRRNDNSENNNKNNDNDKNSCNNNVDNDNNNNTNGYNNNENNDGKVNAINYVRKIENDKKEVKNKKSESVNSKSPGKYVRAY